jgi:Divergent InlB B-repeat domain
MDTGALDFGNIPIAINRSFTISENGNIDLIVSNPTLSGDNASDFKIITPQFPLTIPDGAPAQIITVQCKPSNEGTRTAKLQFTTNDPQNPTVQYALNCNATSLDIGGAISVPTAKYSSLPVVNQAIMFGSALIGQSLNSSIAISELGNAPLEVTFKDMIGPHRNDFKIISGLPATIADGSAGHNVQVQCTPSDTGVRVAILQLATNDVYQTLASYTLVCSGESPNTPTYTLTLNTTGNGVINNCGIQCSQTHAADSTLTLITTPLSGWQFHEWTGDCASNGQIEMTHPKSCTAHFIQTTAPTNPTPPTIPTNPIPPTTPSTTTPTGGTVITPIENGYATGATNNYGQTATNLTIETTGSVAGGTLAGEITNHGLVSNVTVADNSTLVGGKLSGFNTNLGTLQDITVSQYSQIQGGNYAGVITNNGTLLNPILLPTVQILNNGVLDNPVILPGAQVTGGKMTGTAIILGTLENVQLSPNAQVITQVKDIPPAVFSQFNAQTLAKLPASMLSQITPAQFAQIPVKSLKGLVATNMGGLSPQVVQTMNQAQIAALQPEEFKQMPNDGVAKFLTNFDPTAITPQEAEKLLPKDWHIDLKTGDLTAPPHSQFSLKAVKLPEGLPPNLTVPSLPDLSSSFALSGKGTAPVLPQLNQILAKEGVTLAQHNTGILQAEVAGSAAVETTKKKNRFAFMIDPNYLFILTEDALRGLKLNEQGQYILVTDDGKEIPITPMTQNPEELLSILSKDAIVDIRPTGEVLIKHIPNQRTRDGQEVHSVGMFDPFIEPAPEDICTPEGVCNWDQADASMQPGMRAGRNVRAKAAAKVIYPDGSSQKLYPAVLSPDILVEEAKKMKGVEKAIFRMDGTFAVTYQGTKLLLIPEFDTQVQPIPAGTEVKASLTLQADGKLSYQVPYLDKLFSISLTVTEFPAP